MVLTRTMSSRVPCRPPPELVFHHLIIGADTLWPCGASLTDVFAKKSPLQRRQIASRCGHYADIKSGTFRSSVLSTSPCAAGIFGEPGWDRTIDTVIISHSVEGP